MARLVFKIPSMPSWLRKFLTSLFHNIHWSWRSIVSFYLKAKGLEIVRLGKRLIQCILVPLEPERATTQIALYKYSGETERARERELLRVALSWRTVVRPRAQKPWLVWITHWPQAAGPTTPPLVAFLHRHLPKVPNSPGLYCNPWANLAHPAELDLAPCFSVANHLREHLLFILFRGSVNFSLGALTCACAITLLPAFFFDIF